MHRFHADNLRGDRIDLPPGEAHHAIHVLRLRTGQEVELFDGHGASATGRIAAVGRSDVRVTVTSRADTVCRPRPRVHLGFAVPKGKRLDWLLEKATELAAASLTPVAFERSVAGPRELAGTRRDRWLGHCVAAAKQSGLNWLPELHEPRPLADWLQSADEPLRLLGDAGSAARPLAGALPPGRAADEARVLVGPEGGLTDGEREACAEAGFLPARLGSTTLRIETAVVALLAGIAALAGDGETGAPPAIGT